MGSEMENLERQRAWAAVKAVLGVRQTTLLLRMSHAWRAWALVASLPVREARGALAALSLRQQREHGVHMRLQAAAILTVPNITVLSVILLSLTLTLILTGVHMRLQAAQQAEVARLKVENLEARLLLHKAEAVDQLRPTHPAATDKERLAEAAVLLKAAQEAAGSTYATQG